MRFNALVPELLVHDLDRTLFFYVETIGFRIEYQREHPRFAMLSFGEAQLMVQQAPADSRWQVEPLDSPLGRGMNLSIECTGVDQLAEKITTAGFALRLPCETHQYDCGGATCGERHFLVQDPDGYLLRFAQSDME